MKKVFCENFKLKNIIKLWNCFYYLNGHFIPTVLIKLPCTKTSSKIDSEFQRN